MCMAKTTQREIGDWGEEQSSLFLVRNKYEVVARNYNARGGEIDIVAWDRSDAVEPALCFVEVKTRSAGDGSAERATRTPDKLQKMQIAARAYLEQEDLEVGVIPIQFEHISVYVGRTPECIQYEIPL